MLGIGNTTQPIPLRTFQSAKSLRLRFSLVWKSASDSAASSALPTDHGQSLPYTWPAALQAESDGSDVSIVKEQDVD